MAHTPTPWTTRPIPSGDEENPEDVVWDLYAEPVPGLLETRLVFTVDRGDFFGLNRENAEFIVWAVNAHDELVAALFLAESALTVRASLRDGEQARNQRALEAVRAALSVAMRDNP